MKIKFRNPQEIEKIL